MNQDIEKWIEGEDNEEQSDVVHMTKETAKMLEISLANSAYVHSKSNIRDMIPALVSMEKDIKGVNTNNFSGITIDTAANRNAVMRKSQHVAYQKEFRRQIPKLPSDKRGIRG